MVYLRYLTCIVAALAVIRYTIYLEIHTPVVYEVKSALGLDTSNIDTARATYDQPSFLETVQSYLANFEDMPSFSDFLKGSPEERQSAQLPRALPGWMRHDAPITTAEVTAFQKRHAGRKASDIDGALADRLRELVVDEDGNPMELESAHELGLATAGAFYYRENMELLVTISSMPKNASWAIDEILSAGALGASPRGELRFRGATAQVKRFASTGFGVVQTRINGQYFLELRGAVPDEVFQTYLDAISLEGLAS